MATTRLINLLPADRKRAFRREYLLRVGATFLFMLVALMIFHGILLVPSYLYLRDQVASHERSLAALDERLAEGGSAALSAELTVLSANVNRLSLLKDAPAGSDLVVALLAVPHEGIALQSFTFAPPAGGQGQMVLSGIASTREELRAYVSALSEEPYVEGADLPIGAYAEESDIPFTITLTGSMRP